MMMTLTWLSGAQGANVAFGLLALGLALGLSPRWLSLLTAALYFWLAFG